MTTLPSVWLLNDALDALAWRGSTLRERLAARTYPAPRPTTPAAPEPGIGSAPGSAPSSSPDAPAWLARWRALYNPAGPQAFARRLSWDGLDPSTIGSLVTPAAWRPAWTDRLEGIEAASDRFAGGARLLVSRASSGDGSATDPVPFAAAWAPVVASAREALRRRAPRLSSVLSPAASGALNRALMADLSSVAELALHARFVEERGTEPVGTGEGAHDGFVERLLHGGWADVWRRYPVIARLTAVLVGQWVTSTAELIDRIEADRALLADTFGLDASLVSGLRTGLSDPHDGGRRVVYLRFASGLCLAYKPRDITIDAAFHRLLGWIARAGLAVSPPALTVVARESYGWMAWADNDEFDTTERVRDYYRRAGSLLCLTHVLGASDLHGENIVATRSGPVLVDAEALLQPLTGEAATGPAGDRRSCLLTGLLSLVHVDGTGQPYDVGGLRPAEPRTAEIGRRRWRGLASDQIGFDVETLIWPATPNEVRVADRTDRPARSRRRDHRGIRHDLGVSRAPPRVVARTRGTSRPVCRHACPCAVPAERPVRQPAASAQRAAVAGRRHGSERRARHAQQGLRAGDGPAETVAAGRGRTGRARESRPSPLHDRRRRHDHRLAPRHEDRRAFRGRGTRSDARPPRVDDRRRPGVAARSDSRACCG